MEHRFRFEKLGVWQDARTFNQAVYQVTKTFPRDEMFALTSQIRRAATSVAANIAEGSGRNSDPDFARFLEQAYGSLMETASHLCLAMDLGYASNDKLDPILEQAGNVAGRIVALNQSLRVAHTKTPFPRKHTS